jgi:hypothetical protein
MLHRNIDVARGLSTAVVAANIVDAQERAKVPAARLTRINGRAMLQRGYGNPR